MILEKAKAEQKILELNILTDILNRDYTGIPIEFALKEFLDWDESKIKTFVKERKKALKARDKKFEIPTLNACVNSGVCCGNDGTNG